MLSIYVCAENVHAKYGGVVEIERADNIRPYGCVGVSHERRTRLRREPRRVLNK